MAALNKEKIAIATKALAAVKRSIEVAHTDLDAKTPGVLKHIRAAVRVMETLYTMIEKEDDGDGDMDEFKKILFVVRNLILVQQSRILNVIAVTPRFIPVERISEKRMASIKILSFDESISKTAILISAAQEELVATSDDLIAQDDTGAFLVNREMRQVGCCTSAACAHIALLAAALDLDILVDEDGYVHEADFSYYSDSSDISDSSYISSGTA
jgi:hypothetical protein